MPLLYNSSLLATRIAPKWRSDFEVSCFDIFLELIQPGALWYGLPGGEAAVEDVVHFFQCLALGLRCGQEHVDESSSVKSRENHVHLPVDLIISHISKDGNQRVCGSLTVGQKRRDTECQDTIPEPVRRG